ncbi:MAG: hypothetical protein ABW277_15285 [Longimicrobiaceae bacterium]
MSRTQLGWVFAWGLAVVVAGAMHLRLQQKPELESGLRRPIVSLEVAETVEGADRAIERAGGPSKVRTSVYFDFAFILFYVALFAGLGRLLSREVAGPWCWLGVAAIVCAVATGALDVLENVRILEYLRAFEGGLERLARVDSMRAASLLKWGAFFLTMALLTPPLWLAGGHLAALACLCAAVAALGACGLAIHRPAIEWAFTLAIAGAAPSIAAIVALWLRT